MKVLIILGSSNLESRCAELTRMIAEKLRSETCQVEIIYPSKMDIHPCLGCEYCLTHQDQCIYDDDMNAIYAGIKRADVLVFISPVYFSNIPSTLKKVIDRCQLFYNLKDKSEIVEKEFIAVHTGGAPAYPSQFEAFELTYRVLLPDINADLKAFLTFSGSDKNDFLSDTGFIKDVWEALEKARAKRDC